MPANKKHLTKSPFHRFLKISAGFVGGYAITQSFFMILVNIWSPVNALTTLLFGGFILWVSLFISAFMAKNPYKLWGLYLLITFLLSIVVYLIK